MKPEDTSSTAQTWPCLQKERVVPSGACPPEFKATPFKAGSEDMGIILLLHTHDLWRLWVGNGVPRSGHLRAAHLCNCFAWGQSLGVNRKLLSTRATVQCDFPRKACRSVAYVCPIALWKNIFSFVEECPGKDSSFGPHACFLLFMCCHKWSQVFQKAASRLHWLPLRSICQPPRSS